MRGCAKRKETWINKEILSAYCTLHALGFAHSVEAWNGEKLVGGLYGVALGGVFFGESMFHTETDASKIALHALDCQVTRTRLRAARHSMGHPSSCRPSGIPIPRSQIKALAKRRKNASSRGVREGEAPPSRLCLCRRTSDGLGGGLPSLDPQCTARRRFANDFSCAILRACRAIRNSSHCFASPRPEEAPLSMGRIGQKFADHTPSGSRICRTAARRGGFNLRRGHHKPVLNSSSLAGCRTP